MNKLVRSKGASAPASPDTDRKWRAEDALRTLNRAAEIQKDKGLMRDVKACAREQIKTLAQVAKK